MSTDKPTRKSKRMNKRISKRVAAGKPVRNKRQMKRIAGTGYNKPPKK